MPITNRQLYDTLKKSDLSKFENLNAFFEVGRNLLSEDEKIALNVAKFIRDKSEIYTHFDSRFYDLYTRALLFLAPFDFDSYLLYTEKDREPHKKFYLPRRKVLKTLVDDLQDLEEGLIEFLGVSLPTRTGKSTLCIFFMSWVMGRNPDKANLMSGHSDILTDGFHEECLSFITSPEYHWADVFPTCKFESKSAKYETINLNTASRFPTLTCRTVDGTLTGAVEAENYLYCDDLVKNREESMNMARLEAKYQSYLNQLVDRKKERAKELMVGTRWNVADPLGKIQAQFKDNPKYRFRVIPALNENNESNFMYDHGVGFSTEYYLNMKAKLDNNEWMAKYQGKPFIREGLLFPEDELNYYNGTLPGVEPDRIISVCDVAWGGGDSLSQPFCYQFGEIGYIHDVIFNTGDKDVTKPVVVGRIKQHKPNMVRFEANNGGDEYADDIDRILREDGFKTNISHRKAPSNQAKMSRIIQYAPDIKKLYFIDDKHSSTEYRKFMSELTMIVQIGKNEHDDSADSLGQLIAFMEGGGGYCKPMKRPF